MTYEVEAEPFSYVYQLLNILDCFYWVLSLFPYWFVSVGYKFWISSLLVICCYGFPFNSPGDIFWETEIPNFNIIKFTNLFIYG